MEEQYDEVELGEEDVDQQEGRVVDPQPSSYTYTSLLSEQQVNHALNLFKTHLKANTEEEIIQIEISEINRLTKFNEQQISELMMRVSIPLCENVFTRTALEMLHDETLNYKLSVGDEVLDRCLRGGILTRGITEVAGEAGSGKTLLSLSLCLQVQLPISLGGLDGNACYVYTEGREFPSKRLSQIMKGFQEKHSSNPEADTKDPASRIFTEYAPTMDKLWELLQDRLPPLISTRNVKLLIIDSIAAIFRSEFSGEEAMERSKVLVKQANQLKLLSDGFNIPVVVINQVTDLFQDSNSSSNSSYLSAHSSHKKYSVNGASVSAPKVIPSLGLTWSNCVNTRIMLSRSSQYKQTLAANSAANGESDPKRRKTTENEAALPVTSIRKMEVLLASHLPYQECRFTIQTQGIVGIDE